MSAIYFATNRNAIERDGCVVDFGPNFSTEGLQKLVFGVAEVAEGKMVSVSVFPGDDQMPASREVFTRVKQKMAEQGRDTLIIIHGYATTFQQAIEGAWKTKEAYKGANLNVVMFSWPSDGRHAPHDYGNDRHDAQASGLAFARGLFKLTEFLKSGPACGQRLHLLAHSMGNYVLRNALQEMLKQAQANRVPRLFDSILSMAADEDADALDHVEKWARLPELGASLNIYLNRKDVALVGSDITKGNPDRMGQSGPARPFDLPAKVSVIDCTGVVHDLVGHGYYDTVPRVIDDVLQVLAGSEPEVIAGRTFVPARNRYALT